MNALINKVVSGERLCLQFETRVSILTCITSGSISSLEATLDLTGTPKLPKQKAAAMAAPYLVQRRSCRAVLKQVVHLQPSGQRLSRCKLTHIVLYMTHGS